MTLKCSHCSSNNVIGPFEMDGIRDGQYRSRGLFWLVCRTCHRATCVSK